jgi:TolA-binding protein
MSVWWYLRQWLYAHPPVAAAGAVAVLLLVGFGGWASAQQFSSSAASQTAETALYRVTVTKTVRVKDKNGRVVNHVVRRIRTLAGVTVNGKAKPLVIAKDVTDVHTQTVVKTHTVRQLISGTRTVTRTVTQQAPAENRTGPPPGKGRPTDTVTVTVTRTQTVTQPAVTVTVTTHKGH